jgi:malonate-semialdehyde dehydrogenase (acetylating)/methylmalonate-semialdehyde dehydrogenase
MRKIMNYISGEWRPSSATDYLDVINPATAEVLGKAPLSPGSEVQEAVRLASQAYEEWRRTPAPERIQYLFKLKALLEENFEAISRTITLECGKTIGESRGEMRRAIENVEVACGIPNMMMGDFSEDIASGIDEIMIRQPLGVCAIIAPFNFPGMIPFWCLPYAIAAGNTVIVKPSEKVPLTMVKVFELVPNTSTVAARPMASGCRPRAARRTRSSFCLMPIWR